MGIGQDIRRGTVLAEDIENLLDVATLLAARIQLAIRIGTCPTLAKAVVALRVHLLGLGDERQVLLALTDILATLQNDGTQSEFDESQSSKESSRPCTHDDDLWPVAHIRILRMLILIVGRLFVDINTHLQIDEDSTLTGINAATQNAHSSHRTDIEAVLLGQKLPQCLLVGSHLRQHPYLVLVRHNSGEW